MISGCPKNKSNHAHRHDPANIAPLNVPKTRVGILWESNAPDFPIGTMYLYIAGILWGALRVLLHRANVTRDFLHQHKLQSKTEIGQDNFQMLRRAVRWAQQSINQLSKFVLGRCFFTLISDLSDFAEMDW